jgi:hypothetical protein
MILDNMVVFRHSMAPHFLAKPDYGTREATAN